MKLIHAYIDNFGKLSHFEYSFDKGLNVLYKPNGWGKTTFAAFIKAMLYGLPSSRVRDITENERKHYTPVSPHGYFGGTLTFEASTGTYRIERVFGAKEADDRFVLYNTASNTVSHDYGKDIGCELFGVDAAGFERTMLISERSGELRDDGYEQIQSKLVDVSDFLSAAKALERLTAKSKFYQNSKNNGKLPQTKAELFSVCTELESAEASALEYERISMQIKEMRDKQIICQEKERSDGRRLEAVQKSKTERAYAEQRQQLTDKVKEAEANYLPTKDMSLPDESECRRVSDACRNILNARQRSADMTPQKPDVRAEKKPKSTKLLIGITLAALGVMLGIAGLAVPLIPLAAAGAVLALGGTVMLYLLRPAFSPHGMQKTEATPKAVCAEAEESTEARLAVADFITRYPMASPAPTEADIISHAAELNHLRMMRDNARAAYESAMLSLSQFTQIHPEKSETPIISDEEEDSLRLHREQMIHRISELTEQISARNLEAGALRQRAESLPRLRQKKADLEENVAAYTAEYEILQKSIGYITKAQEQITQNYLGKIEHAFTHYISLLCGISEEAAEGEYRLSPSFEVSVFIGGKPFDAAILSSGLRCAVGLCLRLALADAVYSEKEMPPLVLDDNMVHLDDEHYAATSRFIRSFAETHQVLYITCHNSRAML